MTSVALSVQKAEGSVAILDDVSRDYNGQPVETPAITSLGTGALTVEYRAQGGEFTTQAPKAVGSYTVRVTAAADDDYASASAQRNFRITAKRVTIDGVTVEPSKTYDGTTGATIVTGGTLSACVSSPAPPLTTTRTSVPARLSPSPASRWRVTPPGTTRWLPSLPTPRRISPSGR